MNRKIINLLIIIIFAHLFLSCFSTSYSPILKKTTLSDKTVYYSKNQQFNIIPAWYWRLRLRNLDVDKADSTVIGHKFLTDKKGTGLVVGEYIMEGEKFFVVHWEDQGYFFVKETDYLLAEKFNKFLVPLEYGTNYAFADSSDNHYKLVYYYSDTSSGFVGSIPASYYSKASQSGLNLKIIGKSAIYETLAYSKVIRNPLSTNYSDLIDKVFQLYYGRMFQNEFMLVKSCPDYLNFKNSDSIVNIYLLALEPVGTTQYTNTYGQLFIGKQYITKYIIVQWGQVFYALPCK